MPLRGGDGGGGRPHKRARTVAAEHPVPLRTLGVKISGVVNASCTVAGSTVFAFGGFHLYSAEVFGDLYSLAVSDMVWRREDAITGTWPCPRYDHSSTLWCANKLLFFGGCDSNDTFLNDLHVLDTTTKSWAKITTTGPQPSGRSKHSAVIHEDKLYIFGGWKSLELPTGELNVLDLITLQWQVPIQCTPRYGHFSCVHRGCLYAYGGMNASMDRASDLIVVDLADGEESWLSISGRDTPQILGQHFAQICGNRIIVLVAPSLKQHDLVSKASMNSIPTGVWSLDLDKNRWKRHDNGENYLGSTSWHYFAMPKNGSTMLLFGVNSSDVEATPNSADDYMALALKLDMGAHGIVHVPPATIHDDLSHLIDDDRADFSILCDDDSAPPVRVHRLILQTRWPHFAAMSRSGMSESTTGSLRIPEPYATVRAFVDFLYTDSIARFPAPVVADLLILGNLYCLERLQKLCGSRMHAELGVETAAAFMAASSRAGEAGLRARAVAVVLQNFGAVLRTEGWRRLAIADMQVLWESVPPDASIGILNVGGNEDVMEEGLRGGDAATEDGDEDADNA